MAFVTVNWLSIVLGAVAAWLFGGVYYSSTSKWWLAAQGKTMEQCQAEQAAKSGVAKVAPFIVVFVAEIIIAWALYGVLVHMNAFTLRGGVISAVGCWVGFVGSPLASHFALHARRRHIGGAVLVRIRRHHADVQLRLPWTSADALSHRQHRLARRIRHHRRDRRLDGTVEPLVHLHADRADQLAVFFVVGLHAGG